MRVAINGFGRIGKLVFRAFLEKNLKGAENLLIMFPGYLRHYVDSNKSKQDRISMSFNLGCRLQ